MLLFIRGKGDHFPPVINEQLGRVGLTRNQSRSSSRWHSSIFSFEFFRTQPAYFNRNARPDG
jgi:hypothetical protein